jgi:hypothetical protein
MNHSVRARADLPKEILARRCHRRRPCENKTLRDPGNAAAARHRAPTTDGLELWGNGLNLLPTATAEQ